MKSYLYIFFVFFSISSSYSQADCNQADYICDDNGFGFLTNSTGNGAVNDLCIGCVSNPLNNVNLLPGNRGCLQQGENSPTWLIMSVAVAGQLEFTLGNGLGGFYDWAMWRYTDNGVNTSCDFIQNNTLPPVACNWNISSDGLTGMIRPGLIPPGGSQGNFENALNVNAGDQFIICFSNWSGQIGVTVPVRFGSNIQGNNNPNSASVTCEPSTPDQTICLGSAATVNVMVVGLANPTFTWLVTDGVSNPNSGTNVIVTPTQTTEYIVQITSGTNVQLDTFLVTVVPPPNPSAGLDQVICLGQPITLSGTRSPGTTINWTTNTAGITPTPTVSYQPNSTTINPNVTVNRAGVYTFTLTENNGVCPPVADQVQITVSSNTHTTSFVSPSCSGMTDGSITITSANATEYSYDGGATWVPNATRGGFGVGSYSIKSRNSDGCEFSSNVTITEPAQLVLTTSNDTTICQNGVANLSTFFNLASSLTVEYHWSHTTNTSSNEQAGPYTSSQTINVYAEDPLTGCRSNTAQIQVFVRNALSASITPFDTICPNFPTKIGVSNIQGGLTPYSIVWSSGESISGQNFMDINANPSVTEDYLVTISDACETNDITLNTQVFVAPLPKPSFNVVQTELCEPAIFEIHNLTDPTMQQSYEWHYPSNQIAHNIPEVYTTPLSAGNYGVKLIVTSPQGCIDSLSMPNILTVFPKPEANFSWSPNPVLIFNTEVFFQNLSTGAILYEWSFVDGMPLISTQEKPTVKFPEGINSTYPVTLIVTSVDGCKDSLMLPLTVFPEVTIFAPNSFTPDNDEFNNSWNVLIDGIDVYSYHLKIYNRWGEMVFESYDLDIGWDGTYNGKPMQTGTYLWTIKAQDRFNDGKYTWNGNVNILR